MTPEAAVYGFLSGFGIPAYAATSVPSQAEFPYITYDLAVPSGWDGGSVSMSANVWYRTESEALPNAKVREIGFGIGHSGVTLPCDGGMVWLRKGTPWVQSVGTEGTDDKVKRRYLNIDIEYLTIG